MRRTRFYSNLRAFVRSEDGTMNIGREIYYAIVGPALSDFVQSVYNRTVRPIAIRLFGRQVTVFGGVPVRWQAITDRTRYIDYKPVVRDFIDEYIEGGDHVIDIASGRGVFAVLAARKGATVDSYEAAIEMVVLSRETVRLNAADDAIAIHHARIGKAVDLYGRLAGAPRLTGSDLPTADVLILDVEGAELSVLAELEELPGTVIVETHPTLGAPTYAVSKALGGAGYEITSIKPMDDSTSGKAAIVAKLPT